MAVVRPSLITAKTLARTLGPWPFVLLVVWALVIRLQEPPFFARQGIDFFWPSQQAMLLLAVGLLPLIWRLTQGADAALWGLQVARSSGLPVAATFLGIVLYGMGLLVCGTAASVLVDIFTPNRIESPGSAWWAALAVLGQGGAFLLVTASLAPGLALVGGSTPLVIFLWLPIQALALHGFGPSEFSEASGAVPTPSGIVSTLFATLGGLAVSLAHTHHRLRH